MPLSHPSPLREDARLIWQAGVDAVRSERLVRNVIHCDRNRLTICGQPFTVSSLRRIVVMGAGKAGAGMAAAVEHSLGDDLVYEKVNGWVNVPEDCVRVLKKIRLHAARPAGVNEPTREGVHGSEQILQMVRELTAEDLCLVLISGGGSALLPAPAPPLTLEDKLRVTRFLMQAGATIQELNAVRKRLSRIKGGGLARASQAGQLVSLIISDVVGDPLDAIASGPTYPDSTTDAEALDVLHKFGGAPPLIPRSVLEFLEAAVRHAGKEPTFPHNVANHIIGCNQMAIDAATEEAERRGYRVISLGSQNCGDANEEGRRLMERCRAVSSDRRATRPVCLISGGEPTVQLFKTDKPRKGGRNQQLVLAALVASGNASLDGMVILSGGTDGEDGPTDAAGAYADADLLRGAWQEKLDPNTFLQMNDSYSFFERVGGLLKTGPTHTNVMDLRVALINDTPRASSGTTLTNAVPDQ